MRFTVNKPSLTNKVGSAKNNAPYPVRNHPAPILIKNSAKTPAMILRTLLYYIGSLSLSIQQWNNVPIEQFQRGFIKLSKHTLVSYLIVSTVLVGSGIIFLFYDLASLLNPFGGGIKQAEAAWPALSGLVVSAAEPAEGFNEKQSLRDKSLNWAYRQEVSITANTGGKI